MGFLRISGALSGIDTDAVITELMKLERRPLVYLQAKQTTMQAKQTAWAELGSRLREVEGSLEALRSAGTWAKTTGTSSNETTLSVSGDGAVAGSYDVNVISLARAHVVGSAVHADPDAALGLAGTPTINGVAVPITADDTLNTIASRINATSDIGVKASVVQIAEGQHRLVLTSTTTGTSGEITIADGGGAWAALGLIDGAAQPNTIRAAADAELTVNGLTVTRSDNTITDVLPGVTLALHATGSSTVTVAQDNEAMAAAVRDFVESYNKVIDFTRAQLQHTPDPENPPPLYGDAMVRRLESRLRSLVMDPVAGLPTEMQAAWQMGLTTGHGGDQEGRLVLDEAKLSEALNSNLTGIKDLLGAGAAEGIADRVYGLCDTYTTSATGLLAMRSESLTRQMRQLTDRIASAELRLVKREETIRAQFTAMERTLAMLHNQSAWLNSGAQLPGMWTGNDQSGS